MNLDLKHNIYLIGIGGIGMSALAFYFKVNGKHVAGYDRTRTEITERLEGMGVKIHYKESLAHIDKRFMNPNNTLIVYTPAIPENNEELQFFKNTGYNVLKRSEVLRLITKNSFCIAVSGTHGKTTTTSILAHLMNVCSVKLTAFLGGISENYNSNLILKGSEVTVVEADEFDRSFLTLSPDMACITSMDADHLDIYGDVDELKRSFIQFSDKVKSNGKLFVKKGLPIKGITYGFEDTCDYSIKNIKIENAIYVFDVVTPKTVIKNIQFNLPGRHNLSNALVALAMAVEYGCPPEQLVKALASYKGVKRRFSYHLRTENMVLIDDYAHHPEEINAVYRAVKEMYPTKKVLVVFQPHLFSRTKDFADDFATSLQQFDQILLLDIYPAREEPITGITSKWLLKKIKNPNKKLIAKKDLITEIQKSSANVVITMGAGDIGEEVKTIKQNLSFAS